MKSTISWNEEVSVSTDEQRTREVSVSHCYVKEVFKIGADRPAVATASEITEVPMVIPLLKNMWVFIDTWS